MKAAFAIGLGLLFVLALSVPTVAAEKPAKEPADKEVKLEGNVTCGKCELKQTDKCTTVIVVKDGGKEKVYFFDADAHKKYHDEICKAGKKGTVEGTVTEKDGKLTVKVSKLTFAK